MSSPQHRSRSHSRIKVKDEPRSRSGSPERDNFADYDGPREKRRRDEDCDGPRQRKRQDDDYEGPRRRKNDDGEYEGPRRRRNDRDTDYDGPRRRAQDDDYSGPRIKREPDDSDRPHRESDRHYKPRESEHSRGDSRRDRYHNPRDKRDEKSDSHRTSYSRSDRNNEKDSSDRNRDFNGRRRDPAREKDWDNFFKNVEIKPEKLESEKYGLKVEKDDSAPKVEKEKPNFGLSGKLTEETNTFRGVVIKYSEPPEARKPQKIRWRLYPFKENEELPVMFIHRQSAYLLGRDRKIADIPIDHPSCSKQHAVIQYRLQPYTRADGTKGRRVKPYIIDLESANGTLVNDVKIEPKRYVELFEKDVLKFGFSSREYVLLHEHSKDEPDDDEITAPASPLPEEKKAKKIKKEEA